jgi:tRNA G10  N-methylase Trm11
MIFIMKYLAILGRQPELGLLELEALLGAKSVLPWSKDTAVINTKIDISQLGGTQKLGHIIYEGPSLDINEAPIDFNALPLRDGKTNVGLSMYGVKATPRFLQATGLTLKKRLKQNGSIRLVAPQTGTALGAAQVKFNKLLAGGFELMVAVNKQQMVVAITEQVQDIDWYATRDYQRPTRSARVGMLPPKLAQIMVNTTGGSLVYDPFCGTGVVLQESLLNNRSAIGSDNSPQMVKASQENLRWLSSQRSGLKESSVFESDARTTTLPSHNCSIVSEGYLGTNLTRDPDPKQFASLRTELTDLYAESLRNFAKQLDPGAEITITLPMWHTQHGWRGLNIIDHLSDMGYSLRQFTHVDSRALVYRRPNQFVGRQLLVIRKT